MKQLMVFIISVMFIGLITSLSLEIHSKLNPMTEQFTNKIQEVLPSAVHIMCNRWQGSGVAITKDIIVTARHVVDGVDYVITLNDGTEVKGIQAISHKDYDIGFIKIEPSVNEDGKSIVLLPAKFGSIKDCVLGQPIFIIGSPFGKINFNNVTLGIISGLDKDWDGLSRRGEPYGWKVAFTSDSGAHPGNSGGPVFSLDGIVRGLLVGGFSPVLNCSMPSDLFMGDIKNIEAMFVFDKYKVETKDSHYDAYDYSTESREDYYIDD